MLGSTRKTLIAFLALALAVSAVQASSDFHHVHRDHANLKRIVKKRSPQFGFGRGGDTNQPVIGAGQDPAENNPDVVTPTPAPSGTTPAVSGSTSAPESANTDTGASSSSSSSSASDGGLFGGGLFPSNILSLSQSSSTTSSSATSTSSSTSTSTSTTPTFTPTTSASSTAKPTVFVTASQDQSQETEVPRPTGAAASKSNALMILIIIASSLGGIAILWTVFRKWKLGRSSKFDERLQPIDWQPTDENRDDGIIPAHRRAPSNASSFHSASAHGHANGRHSPNGGQPPLQPIPDHDFTAGAAPIGGYADLARGPSPPMGEVNRGQATMGGAYGYDNGVPLHHQTGAYGAYDYHHSGSRF